MLVSLLRIFVYVFAQIPFFNHVSFCKVIQHLFKYLMSVKWLFPGIWDAEIDEGIPDYIGI